MPFFSSRAVTLVVLTGLAVSLAACNKENPYGSDIPGPDPYKYVNSTDPLLDSSPSTQIALFVDKPIENLAYLCDDSRNTRSKMTYLSSLSGVDDLDSFGLATQVPVARCGNEARAVSFFIGVPGGTYSAVMSAPSLSAIYLGTAYLPFNVMGQDGKWRFALKADGTGYEASQASFLFNFSVADLQTGPARVNVAGGFDSSEQCNSNKSDACQVIAKTALVLALDENASDPAAATIKVDDKANTNVASVTPGLDTRNVAALFKEEDYSDIAASWNWLFLGVDPTYAMGAAANVTDRILGGTNRLRAGSYSFNYAEQLAAYSLYFPNSQVLAELAISTMNLMSEFMVYPDGSMTSFGVAVDNMGTACSITSIEELNEALNCVVNKLINTVTLKSFIALVDLGGNSPELANDLMLKNAVFRSVDETASVEFEVFGKFLGKILYDGRDADAEVDERTDLLVDYPSTSYVLKDSEKGSIVGTFGSSSDLPDMPDYINGKVSTIDVGGGVREPVPLPIRVEKVADVQFAPLDTTVLNDLENQNYRLQLMRVCLDGDDATQCVAVDEAEYPEDGSGNYSSGGCARYDSNGTTCLFEVDVAEDGEIATLNDEGDATKGNHVDIRFVRDSTGGLVMQLLDNTCGVRVLSSGKPLNVGYVIATPENDSGQHDSAVVSMLLSTNDRNVLRSVPHLGVGLGGRIDLTDATWPMYRAADGGFNDGIRARWVDMSSYKAFTYVKKLGKTSASALSGYEAARTFYLQTGAVNGQKLDASCNVIP